MSLDSYWITPEDVQQSWAGLREVLEGHSDCQIDLDLVIRNGTIDYICEPTKKNLQPRNKQVKSSHTLWSPIRQLQSIGCNVHGVAFLSMTIVFDSSNNPVLWTAPQIRKLKKL